MSPERIQGRVEKGQFGPQKVDVWSIGILLFILVSGKPPFEAKSNEELFEKISKGEFMFIGKGWDSMSEAKNLIYELLQPDHNDRMEACTAANHSFIRNILYNKD